MLVVTEYKKILFLTSWIYSSFGEENLDFLATFLISQFPVSFQSVSSLLEVKSGFRLVDEVRIAILGL
jgi:hypothetical protein